MNDCNTPVLNEELSENFKKAIEADSPRLYSSENTVVEDALPETFTVRGLIDWLCKRVYEKIKKIQGRKSFIYIEKRSMFVNSLKNTKKPENYSNMEKVEC